MSAWGNKDDIASPGTVAVSGTTITGTGTFFANNYTSGMVVEVATLGTGVINTIASETSMTILSAVEISNGSGKQYTVSEKPHSVVDTDPTTTGTQVFGVSTAEQVVDVTTQQDTTKNNRKIANTAAHAGWVKLGDIYTDSNGNVRRKNETLVAMSSIAGDAADDTTLPDS